MFGETTHGTMAVLFLTLFFPQVPAPADRLFDMPGRVLSPSLLLGLFFPFQETSTDQERVYDNAIFFSFSLPLSLSQRRDSSPISKRDLKNPLSAFFSLRPWVWGSEVSKEGRI